MVSFSTTTAHGAKLGVLDERVHDGVLLAGVLHAYERFNDYIRAVPHHKFSR